MPKVRQCFISKKRKLKFEFVNDYSNSSIKIVSYNNRGKDAEWKKDTPMKAEHTILNIRYGFIGPHVGKSLGLTRAGSNG